MKARSLAPIAALLTLALTGCASTSQVVVPTPWGVAGLTRFGSEAGATPTEVALRIDAQRQQGLVSTQSGEPPAAAPVVVAAR